MCGILFDSNISELFRAAEEHAPSIVFIDEIDAVGSKRYDSTSGGEKEIQRTMLELLNQLDGFDSRGDVKVIMGNSLFYSKATNRIETLDPALIRPGRIDRKIEFPMVSRFFILLARCQDQASYFQYPYKPNETSSRR